MAKRARGTACPAYPTWSNSRWWSFIRSALRSAANRWPPKFEVLKVARRPYKGKNKRLKWEYKCACCGKYFQQKEVSVDHIVPAGALSSYEDVAGFIQRLFVGPEGLQVLCRADHTIKTKKEREAANGE